MATRRAFLKTSAAALAAASTRPLSAWQGANERIRMAVIGCGTRSGRVFDSFTRIGGADCRFVAAAEVNKARLDGWMTPARQAFGLERVVDYRRILDRKDVDAVLIATPDHSHSRITIDAIAAGKDVYCEKPASNSIPRVNAMLDAFRKGKQIVQIGTQQRSWDHFAEAKKILDAGTLGTVLHATIVQPGSYARPKEAEQPVPAGLDWDLWQLDAPKRPFKPTRLGFRAWYAYGSGLIGDWGAHHIDVVHWFMNADGKVPLRTSANGQFLIVPDADPEMVPDTFSISWAYDNFVMTFANAEVYMPEGIENWGVFFVGTRGSLQVNRQGYAVRPIVPHIVRKQGPPPPPSGSGNNRNAQAPIEGKMYVNPRGGVEEDYPLDAHTRNFLDCVKSRRQPNAHMEIGYHSALPALLALESLQQGRTLGWDAAARRSRPL
ncbi:MAG TPA: Gfo/Idh/MocA family oxidoreductase [Vicinamibacterales bacterium]|nr:Gfo/Idh/MocA family oxidoreductase [Vicinamibacterales bacterium]